MSWGSDWASSLRYGYETPKTILGGDDLHPVLLVAVGFERWGGGNAYTLVEYGVRVLLLQTENGMSRSSETSATPFSGCICRHVVQKS